MADTPQLWLHLREPDLAGKVAVVTGATKGIGRAVAHNLASRGCSILGTCLSTESLYLFHTVEHTVKDLYAGGSGATAPKLACIAASILAPDCATTIVGNLEEHFGGHVDIFVNNAGITGSIAVGSADTPVLIVDELIKRKMFHEDSRIVYISSEQSKTTAATSTMYSATKAAGEAIVRSWADAFRGRDERLAFMAGTTANSVLVGSTATDAVQRVAPEVVEQLKSTHVSRQSLSRVAQPADVADGVGLLCSWEARWMTGAVVSADGGGLKVC